MIPLSNVVNERRYTVQITMQNKFFTIDSFNAVRIKLPTGNIACVLKKIQSVLCPPGEKQIIFHSKLGTFLHASQTPRVVCNIANVNRLIRGRHYPNE